MQQGCKIIKSKNIYLKNNNLIIEINQTNLSNDEIFELIICQNIPEKSNEMNTVKIMNGNISIPLCNATGNYTRADQIKTRTRYPLVFGIDPLHISLLRRIYHSKFNYGDIDIKQEISK